MIGDRIKQARIASAMTQDEVVAALAALGQTLTKAGLSKYERGGSVPKPVTLRALGRILGVPADFFVEDGQAKRVKVEWLAFRKPSRLTLAEEERIKTLASAQVEAFVSLRQALEPNRTWPRVPRIKVASLADAEAAAERLRERWRLGDAPIESVTRVIEDAGGVVVELDAQGRRRAAVKGSGAKRAGGAKSGGKVAVHARAEPGFDGLSGWAEGSTPVVVVSAAASDDRRRFSLAHELGHLCMDVGEVDSRTDGDSGAKAVEKLAHRFAAAFLVPSATARRELGERRRHLDMRELTILKVKHGLSMQAWIYRATDLGIIDPAHSRSLFAAFSARGWRKDEPVDFDGHERPIRLRQLTVRAHAEGMLTSAQAKRICPDAAEDCVDRAPRAGRGADARALLKLPARERDRLLERAAAHARGDYGKGGALDGFEVDDGEE
jgi:Zn-dependent peptidase ImmA (M78 family)